MSQQQREIDPTTGCEIMRLFEESKNPNYLKIALINFAPTQKINLKTEMHYNFSNANLESYEQTIQNGTRSLTIEEFLMSFATFKKISPNTYLIGNRGTGIFNENLNGIREKSELRPKYKGEFWSGDTREQFGNPVCILKIV